MKPVIKSAVLAIISLAAFSCSDNDDPAATYDAQSIRQCHNRQTWGLEATEDKIVGEWEWKHAEYMYAIPPADDLTGLKIEFRQDGTGTVRNNKVAPLEFTWSIGTYDTYFGFTTDPMIPQLSGQILFCGNVMFCGVSGSGMADGVDNYYKKVE